MEKRRQPRFTTQFRSTFSTTDEEGQGRTVDLSQGGCKVESTAQVTAGMSMECRLYVPGFDWPLRIDEAIVRWVKGGTFGLEFVRIRQEEHAKLTTLLRELELEVSS